TDFGDRCLNHVPAKIMGRRRVRSLFVIATFGMFGSFAMMFGRVLVMFRSLLVVFMYFVTDHWLLHSKVKLSPGPMKELRQVDGTCARDRALCQNFMGRIFKCGKYP